MKFYTLEYDCNAPTVQQLNIPTNSDYRVGVKVTLNGVEQPLKPSEVTMGGLSADEELVNGYVTFSKSSGDEASYTQETIEIRHAEDLAVDYDQPFDATLKLTENVFKSQQGELAAVRQTGTATLAGEYADGTEFSFDVATA